MSNAALRFTYFLLGSTFLGLSEYLRSWSCAIIAGALYLGLISNAVAEANAVQDKKEKE